MMLHPIITLIRALLFSNVNGQSKGLQNSIQLLAEGYDVTCCTILFTEQKFIKDKQTIYRLGRFIAADLQVDFNAFTFSKFYSFYMKRGRQCKSLLTVIFHEDEATRIEFSELSHKIPMFDVWWYIFGNASLEEWFRDVRTPFQGFIVAGQETKENKHVDLYELYRAHPDKPLRTPRLGYWNAADDGLIKLDIMFNRRNDLEGMVFRTGSTQNAPLHSFRRDLYTGEVELVGYFPEIWRLLGSILNFTSIHYPSVDNVTGIKEDGTWNGLVGMLLRDEIDVAVSDFIMDNQRTHAVDFTRPLIRSSYQIFFKSVGANYNWDAILRPFDIQIWLCILSWIILASLLVSVTHSIRCQLMIETAVSLKDFNLRNSIFFHLRAFCSQGHNVIPSSYSGRMLFIAPYLLTCVLVPSYSAYLISYLTFRTPKRPFDSLQSFLEDGTYRLQTNSKTAEFTYFSEATDPIIQKIYREKMIDVELEQFPLNTQEALDRVCENSRLAHFGDMAIAYSYVKEVQRKKNCDIVTLSNAISTIYSSMAMNKNNPYRAAINHYLQKMEDVGITVRTFKAAFPKNDRDYVTAENHVDMTDVLQTFILLFIGFINSLIILFVERAYYRFTLLNRKVKVWGRKVRSRNMSWKHNSNNLYAHNLKPFQM